MASRWKSKSRHRSNWLFAALCASGCALCVYYRVVEIENRVAASEKDVSAGNRSSRTSTASDGSNLSRSNLSKEKETSDTVTSESDQGGSKTSLYEIQVQDEGKPRETIFCRVLAINDGGRCLIEEQSGRQRLVTLQDAADLKPLERPFTSYTAQEMGDYYLKRLPQGFKTRTSDHWVIVYNTTDAYAKWNAGLYERLYRGFFNYWKGKGIELSQPEFPLVAIVFETQDGFLSYAKSLEVQGAENMLGFYHMTSNAITSYDLTGVEGMIPSNQRVAAHELVSVMLSQPGAERVVATIVHEAVHQIAFNCGLQMRLTTSNPVAISEGIAMFFETPDLRSTSGWGGIGNLNQFNLERFKRYTRAGRTNDSIKTLIETDDRFLNGNSIESTYGESWALVYFLLKTKPKEFAAYLKELHARPMDFESSAEKRWNDFTKHFGSNPTKLDRDFLRVLSNAK